MFWCKLRGIIDWFKLNLILWNEKKLHSTNHNNGYRYTDFSNQLNNWSRVSKQLVFKCTRAHIRFAFVDQNWFMALNALLTHFERSLEFSFCLWWLHSISARIRNRLLDRSKDHVQPIQRQIVVCVCVWWPRINVSIRYS